MRGERRGSDSDGVYVRAYRKLGPRYPESALAVAVHLEHGIVILGVAALGLQAWAIPILLAGAGVLIAYGNGVPFFLMERVMQPVLDDLAGDLGEEVEPHALSLPLSRRLLVALPAINVVTGVAVVGLIEGGHAGIGTLGLAIAASLGVSLP